MKVVTEVQKQVTERFLKAMNYLISSGRVKNKTEFAKEVDYTYPHLLRLQHGGNHCVSIDSLNKLSIKYNINSYWLLTGRGDMTKGNEVFNINQKVNQIYDFLSKMEKT